MIPARRDQLTFRLTCEPRPERSEGLARFVRHYPSTKRDKGANQVEAVVRRSLLILSNNTILLISCLEDSMTSFDLYGLSIASIIRFEDSNSHNLASALE